MIEIGVIFSEILSNGTWGIIGLINLIATVLISIIITKDIKKMLTIAPVIMIMVSFMGIKMNLLILAVTMLISTINAVSDDFVGSILKKQEVK